MKRDAVSVFGNFKTPRYSKITVDFTISYQSTVHAVLPHCTDRQVGNIARTIEQILKKMKKKSGNTNSTAQLQTLFEMAIMNISTKYFGNPRDCFGANPLT